MSYNTRLAFNGRVTWAGQSASLRRKYRNASVAAMQHYPDPAHACNPARR